MDSPTDAFEISECLYQEMIAHVRAVAPQEGCGLIAFNGTRPVKIFPGTNTEHSATRYNMDPGEVVAAFDTMERHRWHLGAIYHSHPHSPATPSRTDLEYAYYPDAVMVIISLSSDSPVTRAFRLDGAVREIPVVVRSDQREAEAT